MRHSATNEAGPEPANPSLRTWERIALGCIVALAAWVYFTTAVARFSTSMAREPADYYTLLTAGIRQGHTYVALPPNPALLTLKDPYDPTANAPYRVHDMSLWQGKYYLYFGISPVLVLFLPVALLTGGYVGEPLAVAVFVFCGFAIGVGLLAAIRRRHFPQAPGWALVLAALGMAFVNPAAVLTQAPQFYQVPIACAFFLLMLTFAALFRGLHSPRPALWFVLASLGFGLTVGARPNYLPSGVVLGIAGIAWWWRERKRGSAVSVLRLLGMFAALMVPAALCGVGLLWYNWLRFGSFTEFGTSYMLAGSKQLKYEPFSLANFAVYARIYLFGEGSWSPYFPFFTPWRTANVGVLRYLPWTWLVPLAFLPLRAGHSDEPRGRLAFASILLASVAGNFALLSSFAGVNDRYFTDFVAPWLMLGAMGAFAILQRTRETSRARPAAMAVVAAAAFSLVTGVGAFVSRMPSSEVLLPVARVLNRPAAWWERFTGRHHGPLHLELELPAGKTGLREPLVQTGRVSDQRDWLFIEYLAADRARLGFLHAGLGTFWSREFSVPASRRIAVELQCGSLFPPFAHPVFREIDLAGYEQLRRDLRITVDGQEVLRAATDCYESPPQDLLIGARSAAGDGVAASFTGKILEVRRPPIALPEPARLTLAERSPIELELFLPPDKRSVAEPLMVTGEGTESDLLYCVYEDFGKVKFALDHYGAGGPVSETIEYDPLRPHRITLWLGALADPADQTGEWKRRLVVLFDGHTLLNLEHVFYPAAPSSAVFGINAHHSSTARARFSGRMTAVRPVPFQMLPPLKLEGDYGAVDLVVRFPSHVLGTADPLVVTGQSGAGDFLYVRYLDAQHVVFGFDHWGIGGITGKPVEIDYAKPHRLELTMGSLYPEGGAGALRTRVQVKLDGQVVLEGESPCHPSRRTEIRLFKNAIGGSTCGAEFAGQVLSLQRIAHPN